MVSLDFMLDSVLMYGAYSNYRLGERAYVTRKFQFQIKLHCTRSWRAGGDSRLNLLPGTVGANCPRFGRSMDRQLVKAGTISPHFSWCSTGCHVLWVAAYLSSCCRLQARRCLRSAANQTPLQSPVLDRRSAGADCTVLSLSRATLLLTTKKEKICEDPQK